MSSAAFNHTPYFWFLPSSPHRLTEIPAAEVTIEAVLRFWTSATAESSTRFVFLVKDCLYYSNSQRDKRVRREAKIRGAKVEVLCEDADLCLFRITGAKGAWAEFEIPSILSQRWQEALQAASCFSDFTQDYRLLYRLASGGFSEVHIAESLSTCQQVAVKIIRKSPLFDPGLIDHEISIMQTLRSEAIGTFICKYEDARSVYIVERRVPGVDLHTYLTTNGRCSEDNTKSVLKPLLGVLAQIHRKGILHCDLKLENVIVQRVASGFSTAIIDFGLATKLDTDPSSPLSAGTFGYQAPEILQGEVPTTKVDIYSVGAIAFALLSGKPPSRLRRCVTDVEGASLWHKVSPDCRTFVTSLLANRPEDRPDAEEALKHKWLL